MAWKLTLQEINEYKAAFTLFDFDQNGTLDEEELGSLMRSLGQNFSNAELKEITKDMKSKKINLEFHEFLEIMAKYRKENDDKSKLIKAFKYFDRDNTGYILFKEFKHVLTSIAEKLNHDEIEKLEEIARADQDGKFNYKELVKNMIYK
jgi:calmodulin